MRRRCSVAYTIMPTGTLDLLVQYTILVAAMDKDGRARCSVQLLVSKSTYGVVLLYVCMYVHISYRQSINTTGLLRNRGEVRAIAGRKHARSRATRRRFSSILTNWPTAKVACRRVEYTRVQTYSIRSYVVYGPEFIDLPRSLAWQLSLGPHLSRYPWYSHF